MTDLNNMGSQYTLSHLEETDLNSNPIEQFDEWMKEAIKSQAPEPTGMTLATSDKHGVVRTRTVLLKFYDDNGFVFFSNYESAKGQAIADNPNVSLNFWWPSFERQVIIQGQARKLDAKHSDEYFAKRPKESNIAAIVSKQSHPLGHKQSLIDDYDKMIDESKTLSQVKRPPNWGGYVVTPVEIEFWQGGAHRLHDRLRFYKTVSGWDINRLYP